MLAELTVRGVEIEWSVRVSSRSKRAAYAALWEPEIAGVILNRPPLSHMNAIAPVFLNVLRVCDIPDVLGMLAPRVLTIYSSRNDLLKKVAEVYTAAEAPKKYVLKPDKTD